jgi:hypothetical protein
VRLLMLGWNRRAPQIIAQLDAYVASGSRIDVMADRVPGSALEKIRTDLQYLEVRARSGDPTDCDLLGALDLPCYQHVIVLSTGGVGDATADFRSLVTLLHLRDLEQQAGRPFGITGEIADDHTLALAPVRDGDDFIVSRTMVSHLMTQVAINPDVIPVFTELFDPEGNEIILRPAADFVRLGCPVTFATVVESARRQAQLAIGYRLSGQIHLNPSKCLQLTLTQSDAIVLIAPA